MEKNSVELIVRELNRNHLHDLIDLKTAAGRPQDMEDVAQLRKLRGENS